jgi:hypothetical protein
MPDLIRHPVFSMDVAYASEDTGSRALEGIRRNDGNLVVLLPEYIDCSLTTIHCIFVV